MGQSLTILKRNGQKRYLLDSYTQLCTVKSAEQKCALLGEDTVTLKLTSAKPLQFVVGDYMEVFGSVYTLNKFDEPTKNGEAILNTRLFLRDYSTSCWRHNTEARTRRGLTLQPNFRWCAICAWQWAC